VYPLGAQASVTVFVTGALVMVSKQVVLLVIVAVEVTVWSAPVIVTVFPGPVTVTNNGNKMSANIPLRRRFLLCIGRRKSGPAASIFFESLRYLPGLVTTEVTVDAGLEIVTVLAGFYKQKGR
jgi:hypothetical protein